MGGYGGGDGKVDFFVFVGDDVVMVMVVRDIFVYYFFNGV